ncbi:MAG: hypothetical protein PF589_02050 [Gammaproteobacteria bacterium]|jgi:hypothetical protein|nr:hypothetical protein [Gammaproteobacteria bacterium]
MFLFYSLLFVLLNAVFAYLLYRFMRFVKNYEPVEEKHDLSAYESVEQTHGYKVSNFVVVAALASEDDFEYNDLMNLDMLTGGAYLDIF